jgi:hypothetical protein
MYRQTSTDCLGFSGRLIQRSLDADGASGQYEGPGGQLLQSGDVDRCEQYGFASEAPAGIEAVIVSDDPQPAVIDRSTRPAGLPALGGGETAVYGPAAESYVRCHDDVTVRSAKAVVHLGRGGTEYPVATADTSNAMASKVSVGPALIAWVNAVMADLATVYTAAGLLPANRTCILPANILIANQIHSYVSTGSAKVKADL